MKKSLLYIMILVCCASCHNITGESQQEKILQQFDSVNRLMDKVKLNSPVFTGSDRDDFYDTLEMKYQNTPSLKDIREMKDGVDEFSRYMEKTKISFYIFCGDKNGEAIPPGKEDKIKLTNDYFSHSLSNPLLYEHLHKILETLDRIGRSDSASHLVMKANASMKDFEIDSEEKLRAVYFKDQPPIAVITDLNSFELTIGAIETQIVKDYLNN